MGIDLSRSANTSCLNCEYNDKGWCLEKKRWCFLVTCERTKVVNIDKRKGPKQTNSSIGRKSTTGEKYIYEQPNGAFTVRIPVSGSIHQKYNLKTLDEAITYREKTFAKVKEKCDAKAQQTVAK